MLATVLSLVIVLAGLIALPRLANRERQAPKFVVPHDHRVRSGSQRTDDPQPASQNHPRSIGNIPHLLQQCVTLAA